MYTRLMKVLTPVLLAFLVIVATSTPAHAAPLSCSFNYGTFNANLVFNRNYVGPTLRSVTTEVYLSGVHPGATITKTGEHVVLDRSDAWDFHGYLSATVTITVLGYPAVTEHIRCNVTRSGDVQLQRG